MLIYLLVMLATLIFGAVLPQKGPKRKYYIILMAVIHGFVCGFRYQYLTGDLRKYAWGYLHIAEKGWMSADVFNEGRNFLFFWLQKFTAMLSHSNFQVFLILIAAAVEIILAVVIYRYSSAPWMSYLIWNCLGFYIFGFSAIKQALAMAFVMLAFTSAMERKPVRYLIFMAIAGGIHVPALIFLPVYWIITREIRPLTLGIYLAAGVLLYIFRLQVVEFVSSVYYEEETVDTIMVLNSKGLGNRFVMILMFAIFGILFRGFQDREFGSMFHIMVIAAILQMFSGFNNVFTRLTDYYFQFSVIYLPMLFFGGNREEAVLPFNKRSRWIMACIICLFIIWFYYTFSLNITVENTADDYLNFRFMWDVKR